MPSLNNGIIISVYTGLSESTSSATSTNPYSIGPEPGDPSDSGCATSTNPYSIGPGPGDPSDSGCSSKVRCKITQYKVLKIPLIHLRKSLSLYIYSTVIAQP